MAKFILDGQEYGGGSGGGTNIVKLTQAEYDALPNDKLSDNKIYLITDAINGDLIAENMFYDGSKTGLGSNVQDAIDKNAESISELNSNIKNITTVKRANLTWNIPINNGDLAVFYIGNIGHIRGYFIPTNNVTSSWTNPIATFDSIKCTVTGYCLTQGAHFTISGNGLLAISNLTAGTTYAYLDLTFFCEEN